MDPFVENNRLRKTLIALALYSFITSFSYANETNSLEKPIDFDPYAPAIEKIEISPHAPAIYELAEPSELAKKIDELEKKTRPDLLKKELDEIADELEKIAEQHKNR